MGFRSINSGVEKLVDWAESKLKNPLIKYEPYRVYLEMSSEDCSLFGKSPCVLARIENTENKKVFIETSFSLYPLVPPLPIFRLCAEARNLHMFEEACLALQAKGLPYDSTLKVKKQ